MPTPNQHGAVSAALGFGACRWRLGGSYSETVHSRNQSDGGAGAAQKAEHVLRLKWFTALSACLLRTGFMQGNASRFDRSFYSSGQLIP